MLVHLSRILIIKVSRFFFSQRATKHHTPGVIKTRMRLTAGMQQSKLNTVAAEPSQLPGRCCNLKNCEMKRQNSRLKATLGTPTAARRAQGLFPRPPGTPGERELRFERDSLAS